MLLYRIAETTGRLIHELELQLTMRAVQEWGAYFRLKSKLEQGIDPDCPFEPGTSDYAIWQTFKKLGAT